MKIDDELNELAASQDGLLTVGQLRSSGVTPWTQHRLVADGWMHRIAPRVYAVRGAPDTHRRRLRAGLLCLGDGSWVSHEAAAALHGLYGPERSPPTVAEFTVERRRRPHVLPFVVHTTSRLSPIDHVVVDGFRVTSATRTILDLASAGADPRRIESAIECAIRRQLSSPEVLARRLSGFRGARRWCRLVEETVGQPGEPTPLERRFRGLAHAAGLPIPRTQVVFEPDDGTVTRVDFVFEQLDAVVEISVRERWDVASDRARDVQRRREVQELGLNVVGYGHDDVTLRPDRVGRTLRSHLPAARRTRASA